MFTTSVLYGSNMHRLHFKRDCVLFYKEREGVNQKHCPTPPDGIGKSRTRLTRLNKIKNVQQLLRQLWPVDIFGVIDNDPQRERMILWHAVKYRYRLFNTLELESGFPLPRILAADIRGANGKHITLSFDKLIVKLISPIIFNLC